MFRLMLLALYASLLLQPKVAHAAGPGEGTIEINDFTVDGCRVRSLTVKYDLDSLFGEPTVKGSYKWRGNEECRLPASTTLFLKVRWGTGVGFVRLAPAVPTANGGYGHNSTGSPNWDNLLCGYRGTSNTSCFDADTAKDFWRNGYVDYVQVTW